MLELFPFQKYSVEYLVDKRSSLLGDDMGLGKTVQAIALDLERRKKQSELMKDPKTLVITYLGIIPAWVKHFQDWSDLKVIAINNKDRSEFLESLEFGDHDVYVCHWQALRLIDELQHILWFHIIADECHALQNKKSQQTKALKSYKSWYKTGLSGTPAFDKPDDLWSILNWLYPEHWSSYWKYYNEHVLYTEYDGYRTIIGVNNEEKLQKEMAGFYIRRRKEDVLLDLPEKYRSEIVVELSPKQRRAYEQMRKEMIAWVGEHEDEPVAAPVVIAQLTRLQQFATTYGVIDPDDGRMLMSEPSTKIDAVIDIVQSTGGQVVVFSQFAQVIKLLGQKLDTLRISHGLFIGETKAEERAQIIERFQAGKLRVFAGTIAAGGTGITLTAASTVVFIDRAWSPSNNRQAEDRLHRIGQKNAVHVIDIIAKDTIDAKRIKQINMKWSWILKLIGDPSAEVEEGDYELENEDEW